MSLANGRHHFFFNTNLTMPMVHATLQFHHSLTIFTKGIRGVALTGSVDSAGKALYPHSYITLIDVKPHGENSVNPVSSWNNKFAQPLSSAKYSFFLERPSEELFIKIISKHNS